MGGLSESDMIEISQKYLLLRQVGHFGPIWTQSHVSLLSLRILFNDIFETLNLSNVSN